MHRKHIRATDAATGTDVDVPTAIWADGQFLIYLGGELFTQFVVQSHNTSTDNAVARWDGTTGHLIQDSTVIIDDAGNLTGVGTINGNDVSKFVRGPMPAVSTNTAIAIWTGTGGRDIANSVVTMDSSGNLTGVGTLNSFDPSRWIRYTPAYFPYHNEVLCVDNFDPITGLPIGASGRTVKIAGGGIMSDVQTLNGRDPMQWVDGPITHVATNDHIALWDTNSGRLIKDSVVSINNTGDITTPGDMTPSTIGGIPVGLLVKSSGGTPHPDQSVARWRSGAGNPIDDSTVFLDDSGNLTSVTTINGVDPLTWVVGPASSVTANFATFSNTTGKRISDSGLSNNNLFRRATSGAVLSSNRVMVSDTGGTINGTLIQSPATLDGFGNLGGVVTIKNTKAIANPVDGILVYRGAAITANQMPYANDTSGTEISYTSFLYTDLVRGPASGGSTDNTLAVWDGTSGRLLKNGSATAVAVDPSTGVITTPVGVLVHSGVSHTDNAAVRWDGTGAHTQDSTVIIDDAGAITGVTTLNTRDPALWVDASSTFPTIDRIMVASSAGTRRIAPTGVTIQSVVVGPASAVDSNYAAFDGATGKLIKDSGIPITASSALYSRNFSTIAGFAGGAGFDLVPTATFHTEGTTNTLQIIVFIPYSVVDTTSAIIVGASWAGMAPVNGGLHGSVGLFGNAVLLPGGSIFFPTAAASIPTNGTIVFAGAFLQSSQNPTFSMHVGSSGGSHQIYSGVMQVTKGGTAPSGS